MMVIRQTEMLLVAAEARIGHTHRDILPAPVLGHSLPASENAAPAVASAALFR
jgi:hypothetical protein